MSQTSNVLAPAPGTAASPHTAQLPAWAHAEPGGLLSTIVEWRRQLHMHPEVAFHEVRTSETIFQLLSAIDGLSIERPTATSVVAELHGAKPGSVIAVRADIDALPITEENDVSYKSVIDGAMHACGHDGHTAIVLGLATLLARHREELKGSVRFIFQHAEELAPGGAQELVDRGVMDGVDKIIGLHLWAPLPVGRIALISGPAMAAPDTFTCTILGAGGHAAAPNQTVDPIAIAAQIITALQQVVSRNIDPLDPVVLSITQFHAGTAFNVIPDSAWFAGTVRSFDADLRESIPATMERMIKGISQGFGARSEFVWERGYRPVVNDSELTARLAGVVESVFGAGVLMEMRPSMGGEDFSAYQQRAPGVFAFVGAGNPARGITHPHHHPRFQIDEQALEIGLRYLCAATLNLLSGN